MPEWLLPGRVLRGRSVSARLLPGTVLRHGLVLPGVGRGEGEA
jgi:hypothetical protein